ncbi:MAG: hypothetical protein K9M55_04700 [Candidatus Marinimicrobia bacterium]|nr:hypothetical protein [Candidatus Neomarinimicrobiota bacterium]MCF7921981.1 hypothetical protein [Candidatus Neomarinimicrobiota bacterium]
MNEPVDLKKLERKLFKTNFQDGIYELAFGMLFLALAINPWMSASGIPKTPSYILELVLVGLILVMGKRYITTPRLGLVRFNTARRKMSWQILIAGLILNLIVVIILHLASNPGTEPGTSLMSIYLIPIGFLVIFSILSYISNFPSLFLLGILFATSIAFSEFLFPHIGEPWDGLVAFGLSALIMCAIGIRKLVIFMQTNPVPEGEVHNV